MIVLPHLIPRNELTPTHHHHSYTLIASVEDRIIRLHYEGNWRSPTTIFIVEFKSSPRHPTMYMASDGGGVEGLGRAMQSRMKDACCFLALKGGHIYFDRTKGSVVDTSSSQKRPSRIVRLTANRLAKGARSVGDFGVSCLSDALSLEPCRKCRWRSSALVVGQGTMRHRAFSCCWMPKLQFLDVLSVSTSRSLLVNITGCS